MSEVLDLRALLPQVDDFSHVLSYAHLETPGLVKARSDKTRPGGDAGGVREALRPNAARFACGRGARMSGTHGRKTAGLIGAESVARL